jgi:hypothetical protein
MRKFTVLEDSVSGRDALKGKQRKIPSAARMIVTFENPDVQNE